MAPLDELTEDEVATIRAMRNGPIGYSHNSHYDRIKAPSLMQKGLAEKRPHPRRSSYNHYLLQLTPAGRALANLLAGDF